MQIKTAIAALALVLAPTLALAEGCPYGKLKDTTASSCMAGSVWDAEKGACVLQPSS